MPKPKSPPKKLAAKTKPSEPRAVRTLVTFPKANTTKVTEDSAMTFGAVFACIRFVSEGLAGLPLPCYRERSGAGSDIDKSNIAHWLLNQQANPETPAFFYREVTVAHALGWGNGFAEIERDNAGRPVWAWQLTPDRVNVNRFHGRIIYDVWNPTGPNTVLEAEDVIHLRGLGFDGLVGYPVIRLAARAIAMGLAAQEATASFFENDSTPGGILKHPLRMSETAMENLRKTFVGKHGGASNRRTLAILEEGMSWEATGLPPEDAQAVQMLGLSVTDIARWFRVPPHKIGDLSKSSFSNIEAENLSAVIDCLMPWAKRFETELNAKLFGRTNRGTLFVKHNFKGRLRGDTAAQTNHVTQMMGWGVYSVNDAREYLDLNPIGPDGDKRFVPLNYALLEKAGEEPPPQSPNQPDPAPADVPNPKGDNAPSMAPWQLALEHACGRVARRESNRIEDAKRRKVGAEWIDEFLPGHLDYMRDELTPLATAACMALNVNDAAPIAVEAYLRAVEFNMRKQLPLLLEDNTQPHAIEWVNDPKMQATKLLAAIRAAGETECQS